MQKALFTFIGNIRWHGILHPFWITINAKTFKLKGRHYRKVEELIRPGDIVVRRFEGYLDKFLIPGWFNHAGIYVGKIDEQDHKVVHATSDGVVVCDLIDFLRTDHLIILRPREEFVATGIKLAIESVGSEYDFAFDFKNTLRFSCTELIKYCYPELIIGKKRFGRMTVVADDIVDSAILDIVWDSRKGD